MIVKCKCDNEYQDKAYGKKNRIHNATGKTLDVRCTVCGAINKLKEEVVKKEKGK